MKHKLLKKSLAMFLAGTIILSQSVFAGEIAAEVPIADDTQLANVTAPDASAAYTDDNAYVSDAPAPSEEPAYDLDGYAQSSDIQEASEAEVPADEKYDADTQIQKNNIASSQKNSPEFTGAGENPPWEGNNATELILGEEYDVSISDGLPVWFKFVPASTGKYVFRSDNLNDGDPEAFLYDSEGNFLAENDDFDGIDFGISYELTKGETYYFEANICYGNSASYTVSIYVPKKITAYTAVLNEGAHLVKESENCGDWYDYGDESIFEYYRTSIQELFTINYTLDDGSTGTWSYGSNTTTSYTIEDSTVEIDFDSTKAVVGTNTATMTIDGITRKITFEIIDLPDIQSFTLEKNPNAVELIIGMSNAGYMYTDTWYDDDGNERTDPFFSFYHDSLYSQFIVHAKYANGQTADWIYNTYSGDTNLDEKYPIEIVNPYNACFNKKLEVRIGKITQSIDLDIKTLEDFSQGTITGSKDFDISGSDFIVYKYKANKQGDYDFTVSDTSNISVVDSAYVEIPFDSNSRTWADNTYNTLYPLSGGETYYVVLSTYSDENTKGSISISRHLHVTDFTLANDGFVPTVGSETLGWYDEGSSDKYYFYDTSIFRAFSIKVTFDDGTTYNYSYDKDGYSVKNNRIEVSQYTGDNWTIADGFNAEFTICGITKTAPFKVSTVIPKIKAIAVTVNGPLYPYYSAYWEKTNDGKEVIRPIPPRLFRCLSITATYEDGTKFSKDFKNYNTEIYSESAKFDDYYNATYELVDPEAWSVDRSNGLKVTVGGQSKTVNIEIRDMIEGAKKNAPKFTTITKSETPSSVNEGTYGLAYTITAPATGEYTMKLTSEENPIPAYAYLYTKDGHQIGSFGYQPYSATPDPNGTTLTVSLTKGQSYLIFCNNAVSNSKMSDFTINIGLPKGATWITPTPTPTPKPTATPAPSGKLFTDVKNPKHAYFKAIYWAAGDGITKGYSDGRFGINEDCTRGAMMMFLWRYAGKPSPKTVSKSPFKDVPKNHAYYKAILWGSQKGITKGYPDGTFGINRSVTRGACMMFLWRLKGQPKPKTVSKSPFKDVPKTHAYYKAILWGAQKKVTTGYTSGAKKGTFGINENCTRGAIVTFLYRAKSL